MAADFGLKTSSREGVFASSLECSETLAFVGDSRGHLVVLDANLVSSPKGPPLTLIKRMQPPTRDRVPVLSVQHMPPTDVPGESTLLTYQVRNALLRLASRVSSLFCEDAACIGGHEKV